LLIDPRVLGYEMAALADDLHEVGQPVVAGFSTHPHWDHLLWHARLGAAPRYGTARCAATARDQLSDAGAKARIDSPSGNGGGAVVCPNGSGARDILAFAYRGQNEANVSVTFSGCATVSNGHIARGETTRPASTLIAITGKKPQLTPVPAATGTKG
jgi:hypothetical protein